MNVAADTLSQAPLVQPSIAEARKLAKGNNLIALRHSFIEDCETPVSAYLKLRELAPDEPAFLLESAEQGQRVGRYSFIGFRPRSTLRWSPADGGDPYALAAESVARFKQSPIEDAPPFSGGAVGFFAYDLVRTVEPLGEANADPLGLPDMALMLTDTLVVFDHLRHTVTILANADLTAEPDVERAYATAAQTIDDVRARLAGPVPRPVFAAEAREVPRFEPNMTRARFEEIVGRIIEYIRAGDAFQVVPSQRWSAPVPVEAFSIYRGLRAVNPSPYMYFLDFCDFQVAGTSPEPLLTVKGRQVSTKPIAGTRPRGSTPEQDRLIAAELLADEKERAEHVMLVDLARNDIGRVSRPGTVKVKELMRVDRFSHVMHLTSVVEGELAESLDALDAFRACFPAGTVSGAPKIRAMERIAELEEDQRGPYAGAVGYLGFDGQMDTCITIRTATIARGVCRIEAGAGIVADSDPAAEEAETRAKARALLRAVELANGGTLA